MRNPKKASNRYEIESRACYLTNWRIDEKRNDTRGTIRNPRVRVRWSTWIGHGDPMWAQEMLMMAAGKIQCRCWSNAARRGG